MHSTIAKRKKIYLYPLTEASFVSGANNYIPNLKECLNEHYNVINDKTEFGIIDMIFKIRKCDYLYLNWIEDMPDKRFGTIQSLVFIFVLLPLAKLLRTKIVWFVHNNLSHTNKKIFLKKVITRLMVATSSIIIAHSKEITIPVRNKKIYTFDHPIENLELSSREHDEKYDILIWGKVSPYKGVYEFVKLNQESNYLSKYKIIIAGKFSSDSYYNRIKNVATENITILNKILTNEELMVLFEKSKYILFTYNSLSVLSSAALCKSLSYKKIIIGPNIGAFKELGRKKIIFTYNNFYDLQDIIEKEERGDARIEKQNIESYIKQNSWKQFSVFLNEILK